DLRLPMRQSLHVVIARPWTSQDLGELGLSQSVVEANRAVINEEVPPVVECQLSVAWSSARAACTAHQLQILLLGDPLWHWDHLGTCRRNLKENRETVATVAHFFDRYLD